MSKSKSAATLKPIEPTIWTGVRPAARRAQTRDKNVYPKAIRREPLHAVPEKRLASTLLLMGGTVNPKRLTSPFPKGSQEVLAEIIGTTRSQVNFFMNKCRKLGLIDDNGDLKIVKSLLSVVLVLEAIRQERERLRETAETARIVSEVARTAAESARLASEEARVVTDAAREAVVDAVPTR